MKQLVVVLALGAAAALFLWQATLSQAGVECEVCVRYRGHERCARAAATTQVEAERNAQVAACAPLTGGVTETLECQAVVPLSTLCEER